MPISSTNLGNSEALVDTDWVAHRLGQTTQWVRDQAAAGAIPHGLIGRRLRFRPSDIERLVEQAFSRSTRNAATPAA